MATGNITMQLSMRGTYFESPYSTGDLGIEVLNDEGFIGRGQTNNGYIFYHGDDGCVLIESCHAVIQGRTRSDFHKVGSSFINLLAMVG